MLLSTSLIKRKLLLFLCLFTFLMGMYRIVQYSREVVLSPSLINQCVAKQKVVFLKTHKTGSSTIQNIFMRYADNHNLLLVLPKSAHILGYPNLQHHLVPRLKQNYSYDMLCHHTHYNYSEMRDVVSGNPIFVTIVRDPVHQLQSQFVFSKLRFKYNMTLEEISRANMSHKSLINLRFNRIEGRNQMAFDLGLSEEWFDDAHYVSEFVNKLDTEFDLVMVTERMEESLVLLRDLLCWDINDVVAFHHNALVAKLRSYALTEDVVRGLKIWNAADEILYNHFFRRLEEKIDAFGRERMKEEVLQLRAVTARWYRLCVEDELPAQFVNAKIRPFSYSVLGFKLTVNNTEQGCVNLVKAEVLYTDDLRRKQKPFYEFS